MCMSFMSAFDSFPFYQNCNAAVAIAVSIKLSPIDSTTTRGTSIFSLRIGQPACVCRGKRNRKETRVLELLTKPVGLSMEYGA